MQRNHPKENTEFRNESRTILCIVPLKQPRQYNWHHHLKSIYAIGILNFSFDDSDPTYFHHEILRTLISYVILNIVKDLGNTRLMYSRFFTSFRMTLLFDSNVFMTPLLLTHQHNNPKCTSYIQLVTPKVVAIAVSTVITTWRILPQRSFFSIVI